MPIYKKVNKDFFKTWSPDMAYVLGFFAADGYITKNRRGGEFWSIQITDKDLLYSIREAIGSEHKISVYNRRANELTIYRLQIGSIEMCADLTNLGFKERKTKSLTVPFVPDEFLSHFVRGYFDGDGNVWVGYIHKKRKIKTLTIQTAFTSASKDFLEFLSKRLKFLGVKGGSLVCKSTYFTLKYSVQNCKVLYNVMYGNYRGNLYLPRKKKVFERYLAQIEKMRS